MHAPVPEHVAALIELFRLNHETTMVMREVYTSGKSGAFVAQVSCSGAVDGTHILKVGAVAKGWDDEEMVHRSAIKAGAFKGKIPSIVASERTALHYGILLGVAGNSALRCKPLVAAMGLFQSAYTTLASILWDEAHLAVGELESGSAIIRKMLGYRLDANTGRIRQNIRKKFGEPVTQAEYFVHENLLFPNPLLYALDTSATAGPAIQPLLGPTHGDCHSQNIFVKARADASIEDVFLIDLESFELSSPLFFDLAYLELATLLRQMGSLGQQRWLALMMALAGEGTAPELEPQERGWFDAIRSARRSAIALAEETYPNRHDDIGLQFLLAQVAAGLAFINKQERQHGGSGGLIESQYQQAMLWSAMALKHLQLLRGPPRQPLGASDVAYPILGLRAAPVPNDVDWSTVSHFNDDGFNILLLSARNNASGIAPPLLDVDWSIVLDFGHAQALPEHVDNRGKLFRPSWPGHRVPDLKLLRRGGIWHYADGRDDISQCPPTSSVKEWRARYRRPLEDLLRAINDEVAPEKVRLLIYGEDIDGEIARMATEAIADALDSDELTVAITRENGSDLVLDPDIPRVTASTEATLAMLRATRSPTPLAESTPRLPCRIGNSIALQPAPSGLLARVGRDLSVISRTSADTFPDDRKFGSDFLRGMRIEWTELAQGVDIERAAYSYFKGEVVSALEASSNRTVNLLHEPSAGGTTLARRLAWDLMESFPTVVLEQLSEDTASHLRELFQFSSLPLFVVMEASNVRESDRELLLRQLREDNTRAVFLWVSRNYGASQTEGLLSGTLSKGDGGEAIHFRDAYLPQVDTRERREALRRLAATGANKERSPFFFGLTAFGENYLGIEQLLSDTIGSLGSPVERSLLADLALASLYTQRGFPVVEFEELCVRLNDGKWPVARSSLFIVEGDGYVRVAHTLLAEMALSALARSPDDWRIDLPLFSEALLGRLRLTRHRASNRVREMAEELFITRDSEIALRSDAELYTTGGGQRRYSPLIYDIGNVVSARAVLRKVVEVWPEQPHFAAHLARHLAYEEPKEVQAAIDLAIGAEDAEKTDVTLSHVVGTVYRIRVEERLREALAAGSTFDRIEHELKADFEHAVAAFDRSLNGGGSSSHGLVSKIQLTSGLLRQGVKLSGTANLSVFLQRPDRQWYLNALSEAENCVDVLRRSNQFDGSARIQTVLAEWNLVYGNHDSVIGSLRAIARSREDVSVRRALCSAIMAKAQHNWARMAPADLRTIVELTDKNIGQQGVQDADVRRWLAAYRRLSTFDIQVATARLIDWHEINPHALEPAFYLYVFYVIRWLESSSPREGFAVEALKWLQRCRQNRPLGQRSWSYEWVVKQGTGYGVTNFRDLGFDPSSVLREDNHKDRTKLASLAKIAGVVSDYRGPQHALLDLGNGLSARITPLDRLAKDDEGTRARAFIAFSYDGIIGWDAVKSS